MAGKTAKGKPGATGTQGQMSDAAVQRRTRKTWPEWFVALDSTGARTMSHREIVAVLRQEFGIPDWWQQMVAVGYEQARGLRKKHEGPDGYQIGVSRTVGVPLARLYRAFADGRARRRWLPEPVTVRKATPVRSMRVTWEADGTSLSVNFSGKGEGRSQVTVNQEKLPDERAAAAMKQFWGERLDGLRERLEG